MGNLAAVVRMVAQRSLGHRRLFLAMAVGSVLCSALLACVVLYSDTVRDLGLSYQLRSQERFAVDTRIQSTSQRYGPIEYGALRKTTDELVARHTPAFSRGIVHYGRSATFFPTNPGEAVSKDERRLRAHFQWVDSLEQHVRLVEGKFPERASLATAESPPELVEVVIGREAVQVLAASPVGRPVKVGDEFDLYPHWRATAPVRVKIVGIIEPNDITEEYWFGRTDRFALTGSTWETLPFWASEGAIVNTIGGYLPDMDGSLETYIFTDRKSIKASNARRVEGSMGALKADVRARLTTSGVDSQLDSVIKNYREKLFFTRVPLFALMIQIVGIVLFYLIMVSTMVVERQTGEIALLKSRGAGTIQIMMIFLIEGLGITFIATVLGPLLAWAAIAVLGLTPPFKELSEGSLLTVTLTPLSFALALAGGLMALAALLLPAYRATRFSITNYKQQISRPPRQSAFLRYYLDLVLVVIAGFAFYQLRQQGSFVTEGLFGDLSADPILLATPTLFMLMVALVFLRLFPLSLRLVLWCTRALSGPTVSLSLMRMARSPLQHSRLILLLLLATAVGMFAAGFRATLERGYEDRAAYKAGAEVRLVDIRTPSSLPVEAFKTAISTATGSTDLCPVIRANVYYSPQRFKSENLTVLGVPPRFCSVPYWREDFAGPSFAGLLGKLEQNIVAEPPPIAVPPDARYLGFWALNPLPQNVTPMGIRLRDADGSIWEYRVGLEQNVQPAPNTWLFYVADLTRPTNTRPNSSTPNAAERKWVFEAFWVATPGTPPMVSQQVSVYLDDLQTFPATAQFTAGWSRGSLQGGTIIEPFDDISRYELVKGVTTVGDPGALARAQAENGRSGPVARVNFIRGRSGSPLVAFRTLRDSRPLPVLADKKFLERNTKKVGDEIPVFINSQYVTVRIAGTFDLFPTYDPEKKEGLLVADFEALQGAASRVPGAGSNFYANEAWLGDRPATPITKEFLKGKNVAVEGIFDREAILAEQASDPLVAASWEGILFIAFAGVLLVSALGFVTYSGLGAQARSLEFAILRTMGLSGRQILAVVSFEQIFVVVAGVAVGTLLGFPLSRLMIGYMGLTESGRSPLPPLQSVISWQAVLTVYLLLGTVVAATVVTLVALYSRLAVSRALRMGEL